MTENVTITLILAATTLSSICIWIYFSPYQFCVRSGFNALQCLQALGGWGES